MNTLPFLPPFFGSNNGVDLTVTNGIKVWWDDEFGVELDETGGITTVKKWKSKTGNGYDLVQNTKNNQLKFDNGILLNRTDFVPSMQFNINANLQFFRTTFVVIQNVATPETGPYVLNDPVEIFSASNRAIVEFGVYSTGQRLNSRDPNSNSDSWYPSGENNNGNGDQFFPKNNQTYILTDTLESYTPNSSVNFRKRTRMNGREKIAEGFVNPIPPIFNYSITGNLVTNISNNFYIKEIIQYERVLDAVEILSVENYLKNKHRAIY